MIFHLEETMFNGIVEAISTIKTVTITGGGIDFLIACPKEFDDLFIGASVAVNGVCLTVTHFAKEDFTVTAVPETLRITNLSYLKDMDFVNLERAMKTGGRMGGHYVQGHVDAVGEIVDIKSDGNALLVTIKVPAELTKYLVKKGYVGIDGMSITVIDVNVDTFTVTLIPLTCAATIAHQYRLRSKVNIEVDILGKYVEKILGAHTQCNPI